MENKRSSGRLMPDNAVLLLIDHQVGLFTGVRDIPVAELKHNVVALAKAAKVPVFSSSGLRFSKANQAVRRGLIGKVTYAETYGPCEIEPHHPDLFWYGVHGIEALFTVMGPGCESVQRGTTPDGKIEVTGTWTGKRKGIYREEDKFHGLARGRKGEAPAGSNSR